MATQRNPIRRLNWDYIKQAEKVGQNVLFDEATGQTTHQNWLSEQYGGIKMLENLQIGGQKPGFGPDALKYIRQFDPDNTAGAMKDGLNIMEKLQGATETPDLLTAISPLQGILGGDLYGKMQGAGSKAKSSSKTQEQPVDVASLIQAALDCTERKNKEDRDETAVKLNADEINRIKIALENNSGYTSAYMPKTFVDCINSLIPTYRNTV